jgi:predicted transcriptional regulator
MSEKKPAPVVMIGTRVTPKVARDLQKAAAKDDRSVSYVLRGLVENYLDEQKAA